MKHYTRCLPCEQALKANALVGTSAGGTSLLAKQHNKRQKSLAEGKKAGAHSAHVRVVFGQRFYYAKIVIWLCG